MLTIGAIMREPLPIVMRFVSWYLEAGADQIIICFDDPDDPAVDIVSCHPRIRAIRCDTEFWDSLGFLNETRFAKRQNAAMTALYRQTNMGWFFNVDADEYLWIKDKSLPEFLEEFDSSVLSIAVETAEVLVNQRETNQISFRLPMDWETMREVYGHRARLFQRRRGLIGHDIGKSFTRAGLPGVRLRQHWAELNYELVAQKVLRAEDGAYLLHFIETDYETWRRKLDWRLNSSGFANLVKQRLNTAKGAKDPEEALKGLYYWLHRLSDEELARLKQVSRHLEVRIDFDHLVAKHFPQAV